MKWYVNVLEEIVKNALLAGIECHTQIERHAGVSTKHYNTMTFYSRKQHVERMFWV